MANQNQEENNPPATERFNAPGLTARQEGVVSPRAYVPPAPLAPTQMRIGRAGQRGAPLTRVFPQVRGGVCEYCGIIDPNTLSQYQYKLCPHYRGMQLFCVYHDTSKDPDEVVRSSVLHVAEDPDHKGELVVWCDVFECSKAHLERYNTARY